jgi:hypothetical protein
VIRIVLAIPWGIEGYEISGMKFHPPLFVIFLGLDWQKSKGRTKSIYPKRADFYIKEPDLLEGRTADKAWRHGRMGQWP